MADINDALAETSRMVRASDHPLVQFVLATTPYAGGVGYILSRNAAQRQESRLRRFLLDLSDRLGTLEEEFAREIDEEHLESDEYLVLFETVMAEAAKSSQREKLRYLQDFLIAGALKRRPDTTWIELFLDYVARLSGAHLMLLGRAFERQGHLPRSERLGSVRIDGVVPLSIECLKEGLSIDVRLAQVASNDLDSMGLLVDWHIVSRADTALQAEYCLSESGLMFMRFMHRQWACPDAGN